MKYIRLFEDFQLGDLNFMSPEEIQKLFFKECRKQTPDMNLIRVILDNGLVDVNVKDDSVRIRGVWVNKTPLHMAVDRSNIELIAYLIEMGADVNAYDGWGKRPLHLAVFWDNIVLAKYLISVGAKVNVWDDEYRSPLDLAYSEEMKALLIQNGAVE